jgi:hypothetical protein
MAQEKVCSSCRVPLQFSRMNVWNSDGTITQARNPDHRLFFYDADGFDRLFANVTELIGVSVERIVIDSKRKATLDYLHTLISGPRGALLRTLLKRKAYGMIATTGALMGYGHYELEGFKRGEYIRVRGDNVYCPALISADLIAVFNYIERLPADLHIEDEAGSKLITVERGEQFETEFTSRLAYRKIPRKPGRISIERCPDCGLPIDFKKYSWHTDRGVMTDKESGRNMVLMGPNEIDSIFSELEAELGGEITRAVVEGQCRYVREELQERETSRGGGYLARQLALRGMGNLVRFELGEGGLRAEVENASPYLMVTGLIKGIYEAVTGRGSECDYRLTDDGTLFIEVSENKPAYVV